MTTLRDFGGVVGWPLDTFFWALAISWSRVLACVCEVALRSKIERKRERLAQQKIANTTIFYNNQ